MLCLKRFLPLVKEGAEDETDSPAPAIPPQTNILFHVAPEETSTTDVKSAYDESDWDDLVQLVWFWGYMNRGDCERKLYNEGSMGDFVVRLNSNQQLVVSLW